MRILAPTKYVMGVTAAVAVLTACSSGSSVPSGMTGVQSPAVRGNAQRWSGPVSIIPAALRPVVPMPLRGIPAPESAKRGIYVNEFLGTNILGFVKGNRANGAPFCNVGPVNSANDIAVDGVGNLIDPDGGTHSIQVFGGPGMCGARIAAVNDPFGQPAAASSANAMKGVIAVADYTGKPVGGIALCTIRGGCTTNLTNPSINQVVGVAMDSNGNCWASGDDSSYAANMTYFAGCAGSGVTATGYKNTSIGGLDIDNAGNIVSIDGFANGTGQVYVYSGCNPTCTVVGGPFPLHGEAFFGHLNKLNGRFATGNFVNGQVDIYKYSPKSLTYLYSFNNGLNASLTVEGVAYDRRSKQ
jgi:hypothetical protein